ncbi:MAG: DUF2079 domain-containing protein [Myxococcales bacterium]|nr:DUF2079 domain-containing protein [Myxococcales bacterium]
MASPLRGTQLAPFARGFGLLLGAGACVGIAIWELVFRDQLLAYIQSNEIEPVARKLLLLFAGVGIAFPMIGIAVYSWRRRAQRLDLASRIESVAWKLSPLCLSIAVPMLFQWQIWKGRDIQFLVIAAITAITAQKLFYRSLAEPPLFRAAFGPIASARRWAADALDRWSAWLPWVLVIGLFFVYAAYFSFYTLRNHWNLGTSAYDMAIEDNVVFNAMRGELLKASPIFGPEGTHLGHHATFFAYVLVPIYALAPRAETLLVIQATLIGAAVVPLFLFARNRFGPYQAASIAAMYVFYAPLHGGNLYDFHYPPLGIGFVFWLAYLVDIGKYRWAVVPLLLSLSVREDIALSVCVLGAYFLLSNTRPRAGLALSLIGLGYFVIMKMGVMPLFRDGKSTFVWYYEKLVPEGGPGGFGGVLVTIFGNPGYTLGTLLDAEKIKYFLQVMVPFVFLPFRRPIGLVFCLPGLLMTLLATRSALYNIGFQYTTHWALEMFLASVVVLTMIKEPTYLGDQHGETRVRSWLLALALAMAATSYQHGAILQQNTARGGFSAFKFERTERDIKRYQDLMSLCALIPPEAKVGGTEKTLSHVSNRPDAYTIRYLGIQDAQYILFQKSIGGRDLEHIHPVISDGTFGVVQVAGDFILARRGHSTELNAATVKRLRKPRKK